MKKIGTTKNTSTAFVPWPGPRIARSAIAATKNKGYQPKAIFKVRPVYFMRSASVSNSVMLPHSLAMKGSLGMYTSAPPIRIAKGRTRHAVNGRIIGMRGNGPRSRSSSRIQPVRMLIIHPPPSHASG